MNRWYDKHEELGRSIDLMKKMSKPQLDRILKGILEIIKDFNPTLLDDFVLDFPMDLYRKRWYDKDPYLWITINGLSFGNKHLWDSVASWVEKEQRRLKNMMPSTSYTKERDVTSGP